ncbi:uncharacterized protein [Anoplolepis gracilipes]|uniref:uncharacterized protein n=1 Tax=Anoplolepis gracilipes TaxID=354296 RepID=UPI003BA2699F
MLVRASYTLSFVFVVCCWVRHNAAIPFASHFSDESRMRNAFKDKEMDSQLYDNSTQNNSTKKTTVPFDGADMKLIHKIINRNENVNMNIIHKPHNEKRKGKKKLPSTVSSTKSSLVIFPEEKLVNCSSSKKKNQRYSSSFENRTNRGLNVDKEIKDIVGNNTKAKINISVYEDEDITLCWTETTTIKENRTVRPLKRLVIREYMISFENSATIPDKYLECKRFEGEITMNDEIGKTTLFEVIDEDTKVSRLVNFTVISHVGDLTIWQHKNVKCGVGPVVTKKIIEWNDGSKNPKKRVEIKVSPKMHKLTAVTTQEPCTESTVKTEETNSPINTTTESCTGNSTCGVTTSTKVSVTEESESTKIEVTSKTTNKVNLFTSELTLPGKEIVTSTIVPDTSTTEKNCEGNSTNPSCTTQKISHSSFPEELIIESETTKVTTELPKSTSKSKEKIIDLTTEKITLFTSMIEYFTPSSHASQSTEKVSITTPEIDHKTTGSVSTLESSITTSSVDKKKTTEGREETSVQLTTEESKTTGSVSTLESSITTSSVDKKKTTEGREETSVQLTTEESKSTDHVLSSNISTVTSDKISTEHVTTTVSQFTESEKPSTLSGSFAIKSTSESVTTQSSSTFAETSTDRGRTTKILPIETTKKKTATSTFPTITSSTEIKPTAVSSTTSDSSSSCESSSGCSSVSSSESCESSESCTEESSSESEEKPTSIIIFPTTKNQSFTTKSESLKKSTTEIQHTTVPSVATTTLTTQKPDSSTTVTSTQKSTTTSTLKHKLILKVKVLLEHIDEKKEKHNLIEVGKQLSFDENSVQDNHSDLLKLLKSLNESVNRDTLNALLNYTSLGNLTKISNIISINDTIDNSRNELEFTDLSVYEDLILDQSTPEHVFGNEDQSSYPEYNQETDEENDGENAILSRRRRRRSFYNKMDDLDGLYIVRSNLIDPDKLSVNPLSVSEDIFSTKETHPFTTTNNPEEETSNAAHIDNEGNITTEGNDSSAFMTTIKDNDTDSSTLEYQDVNVTKENVRLSITITNPEHETDDTVRTRSGNDITTTEIVLSTVPLIKENVDNKTKKQVVQQTLPGIQEDVLAGLQHVVLELMQNNLPSINDVKKIVQTSVLSIIANPKDDRIHSRIKREAAEQVGHWSNERIKEAPMGGSLRSFTEFTLYKVLS